MLISFIVINFHKLMYAEDESFGMVSIFWRLTEELRRDSYKTMTYRAMMKYLSSGITSPMQKVGT